MKTPFLLAVCLALARTGCHTTEPVAEARAAKQAIEPHPPQLVGVWFGGLDIVPNIRGQEYEIFGLCGTIDDDLDTIDGCTLLSKLDILSTFRSAREAVVASDAAMSTTHLDTMQWFFASYDDHRWTLSREFPPQRDFFALDMPTWDSIVPTIGVIDAEWRTNTRELIILPPPLRQRGIAVASYRPRDVACLLRRLPGDVSTSLFRSWDEIERSFAAQPPYLMWECSDGPDRVPLRWQERDQLKSTPDWE